MRSSCLDCAIKHLSQALVLIHESKQGYPLHKWFAIGHLAEASDELIKDHAQIALKIRTKRLEYANNDTHINFSELIEELLLIKSKQSKTEIESCCTESKKEELFNNRNPVCMSCVHYSITSTEPLCAASQMPISLIGRKAELSCPEGHW